MWFETAWRSLDCWVVLEVLGVVLILGCGRYFRFASFILFDESLSLRFMLRCGIVTCFVGALIAARGEEGKGRMAMENVVPLSMAFLAVRFRCSCHGGWDDFWVGPEGSELRWAGPQEVLVA